jgi:hypothetical protein
MKPPVSVCHQVSDIGHLESPTTLKNHLRESGVLLLFLQKEKEKYILDHSNKTAVNLHALGLIGSPTLPRTRKDFLE